MRETTTVGEKQRRTGRARLFGPTVLQTAVIAASGAYLPVHTTETTTRSVATDDYVMPTIADTPRRIVRRSDQPSGIPDNQSTVRVGIAALVSGDNVGNLLERTATAARSKGGNTCTVANA